MITQPVEPLILLGAGASSPAGIPTATEMTVKMLKDCREPEYAKAINALAHMLSISHNQGWSAEIADIESVMNASQFLGNRSELEFAPFVGTWHPIIENLERQKLTSSEIGNIADRAASAAANALRHSNLGGLRSTRSLNIDEALNGAFQSLIEDISGNRSHRPDGAFFNGLSNYLTGKLLRLTWLETAKNIEYLFPVIERGRKNKVEIFTLNYDNCVERAAEHIGVSCSTGLTRHDDENDHVNSSTNICFGDDANGVDLVKLHGSTTWLWSNSERDSLGLGRRVVVELSDEQLSRLSQGSQLSDRTTKNIGGQLAVIFAGRNKLTAEGPFLEFFWKFKESLARHSKLLIIGYSFRDAHVNHCILRWLRDNINCSLVIVDRKPEEECLLFQDKLEEDIRRRCEYRKTGAADGIKEYFNHIA